MARTSRRSLGSNSASSPGPPLTVPAAVHLDRPGHHHQPGALVHLVLVEPLAGWKLDHDRAPSSSESSTSGWRGVDVQFR